MLVVQGKQGEKAWGEKEKRLYLYLLNGFCVFFGQIQKGGEYEESRLDVGDLTLSGFDAAVRSGP